MYRSLREVDSQVADALYGEVERQSSGLELIASENFVSEAVLETMGSVLTNKYAEGYPGRRYYGGCEFSDVVERLARNRAKQLKKADICGVQQIACKRNHFLSISSFIRVDDHENWTCLDIS